MSDPVRRATADDLDGIADSLTLSFQDDPVMTWLFGDEAPRPMRYIPFYRRHGFGAVGEATFPSSPTIWPMGGLPGRTVTAAA